jgi:hypothetical protein
MAAMSNNNDSRVVTIDVESTGRDTKNSPLVNVYCEELGAVKFSMALYKLPEEDWKLMEAGTSCRVRLERGRPKTIGVENKDLDYYWEWRGFVTGGPERPIEAVGPPVTNTAANAGVVEEPESQSKAAANAVVREAEPYGPVSRYEQGMALGNAKGVGGNIISAYIQAMDGDLPNDEWLIAAARTVNVFSSELLIPTSEPDELTPADLSDDGEISGLDEVHDDQEA